MADHSKPVVGDTYANVLSYVRGRFDDLARGLDPATSTPTNPPTGAVRWSSASKKWEKWNGTSWGDLSDGYAIQILGGAINNTPVGAATPSTGAFTTLSATGNVTLGDASTDTVTVNGCMGVGGAASTSIAQIVRSAGLAGIAQIGVYSKPVGTSDATAYISAFRANAGTAVAPFTTAASYGFYVEDPTKGAGSTITTAVGLHIADQTAGTNNYGITSAVSAGANKRNLNITGTADNYIAGKVGFGVSAPEYPLDVVGIDGILLGTNRTDASIKVSTVSIKHYASATAAFGALIGESNATQNVVTIGGGISGRTAATDVVIRTAANNTTTTGTERVRFGPDGHGAAGTDNAQTWGTAAKRWSVIYAGTGTINTSDGTQKLIRGELSEQEMAAWAEVRWLIYQWRDAVAQKGEAVARLHAGLIAQDIAAAFAAAGLDASRYALWCADEIFEDAEVFDGMEIVDVPVMDTVEVIDELIEIVAGTPTLVRRPRIAEQPRHELRTVFDEAGDVVWEDVLIGEAEDGSPLMERRPVQYSCPVFEPQARPKLRIEKRSLGLRYGLRYDQCQAFEAAYLRTRLAQVESRLAALESAA